MGSLQTEIQRTLNSWEAPRTTVGTGSIASKVFNFIKEHPACTSDDIASAVGIDIGRSSATLLTLYQKGKLDRKVYPNPNPDGKRHEVYTYWTAVDNFTDRGVDRRPKKPKKQKRESTFSGIDIDRKFAKREPVHIDLIPVTEKPVENPYDSAYKILNGMSIQVASDVYKALKEMFK